MTPTKPGQGEDEATRLAREIAEAAFYADYADVAARIQPIIARFLRAHDSGDQWLNALDRAEKAEAALAQFQRRAQEADRGHECSWISCNRDVDTLRLLRLGKARIQALESALREAEGLLLSAITANQDFDFKVRAFLARPEQEPLHQSDCPHADPQAPCICPEQEPEPPQRRTLVDVFLRSGDAAIVAHDNVALPAPTAERDATGLWICDVCDEPHQPPHVPEPAPAVHPEAPRPPSKRMVGCDNAAGTLNIHGVTEWCEVCTPPPLPGAPEEKG